MIKLLRTIRFDETDPRVYETAAETGEWAVPGSFLFAGIPRETLTGKVKQAFTNGFLGLGSFGFSTFATVGEITEADAADLEERFADLLVAHCGAPSREAALAAARDELAFARDLCKDQPINTVFTLRRILTETGDTKEEFRTITPPSGDAAHARVWSIEREDDDGP